MHKLLAVFLLGISLALVSPASADEEIQSYIAHLSAKDHVASDGVKLTTVAEILRQDRANFHKFGKADPDDQSDELFNSAAGREVMEKLVAGGNISPEVKRAILTGTPHVVVTLYNSSKGKEYIGIDFTN